MADSIDRVFAHALNTVKRIPRLGSARPPVSERLRLYGLYKQAMEGDVEGVMERPRLESAHTPAAREEVRSEQAKWDAWHRHAGTSRTEAKRRYIATLIETMHKYANHTPDARELVGELEFVWAQIESNVAATSSSNSSHSPSNSASYPSYRPPGGTSTQSSDERSALPRTSRAASGGADSRRSYNKRAREQMESGELTAAAAAAALRVLDPPMGADTDGYADNEDGGEVEDGGDELNAEGQDAEHEDFVDAPDSQVGLGDDDGEEEGSSNEGARDAGVDGVAGERVRSRSRSRPPDGARAALASTTTAGAILGPIVRFLTAHRQETAKLGDTTSRWQRRVEGALIQLNAEVAALRELLEWGGRASSGDGGDDSYSPPAGASSGAYSFGGSGTLPPTAGFPWRGGGRRRPGGWRGMVSWAWGAAVGLCTTLVKHALLNALLLVIVTAWMRARGIPAERLERLLGAWVRAAERLPLPFLRGLRQAQQGPTGQRLARALPRSLKGQFRSPKR